jgi:pimeloyl-ACP methyl ester carboxylesterase
MKYIRHCDRAIAYTTQGRGPVIVLLHGFCEDSTIWNEFQPSLAESGFQVVCIDLPGFGQSEPIAGASIEQYADAVLAVADALELPRFVLIGHSMGGYTALAIAEKQASRLAGLGMFHSHPYADSEAKKEARQKNIQFIQNHGHIMFAKQLIPVLFAPAFAAGNSYLIGKLVHAASACPQEGIIGGLEAMIARPDRSHILKNSSCPVLFIVGEEDQVISSDQSLSQTVLPPVASVHIIEKTGHMGMLEAPKKTERMLREFAVYCFHQASAQ